jgi:catechol 2,3-dioxygenase-like lactoylglutathione lyase family enzyme
MFLVFDPRTTQGPPPVIDGVPIPTHGTVGQGHIAFAVTEAELDTWAARLAERHVAIEARIAWPNGGRSIYVRDPAGNSVEFATPRLWGIAEEALA